MTAGLAKELETPKIMKYVIALFSILYPMRIGFNIVFEDNCFYDYQPEEKSPEELVLLMLSEASGRRVNMKKYSERDIAACARRLIMKGMLKGTVRDRYDCTWSRLTKKGYIYLNSLEI